MNEISHRQLVSALLSLIVPSGPSVPTLFRDFGYELVSIELPLLDHNGDRLVTDLFLLANSRNVSLMVECKTNGQEVNSRQIGRYMNTGVEEVVLGTNLRSADPSTHECNVGFFATRGADEAIIAEIAKHTTRRTNGLGIVSISESRMQIIHDELTDDALSTSLTEGWSIRVGDLPLERLPYEVSCPRWELANAIFVAVQTCLLKGRNRFSLLDICRESNPFWDRLGENQNVLSSRIRNELRTMRRTALKSWIVRAHQGGREEEWRFKRKPSLNRKTLNLFARHHARYISILREENRDPRADDFVKILPEQLQLPDIPPGIWE